MKSSQAVVAALVLVLLGAGARPARGQATVAAPPAADATASVMVEGEVVRSRARHARGGRAIVTESVIRTAEGEVTVRQLGGTVDGVAMLVSHAPPLLATGDRVRLAAGVGRDRGGRASLLIREVERLEAAPLADEAAPTFVRTLNQQGGALYWDSSCVFVSYDAAGTDEVAGDDERDALDEVFARWRSDTAACSYLEFVLEGPTSGEVGNDGVNLIKFRDDEWCRPATDDEPEECYAPEAAGLTTLWFVNDAESDRNGQIFDADIEINAVNFTLAVDGETVGSGSGCVSDVANTMTHEVGHLMGLDHTCWSGVGPQPVDDEGAPVVRCDGAVPAAAQAATMFAFQDCGETSKTSPEPDDVAGVCTIYPVAAAAPECSRPSNETGGCCAVAGRRGRGGAAALPFALMAMVALLVLRRR